MIFPAALLLFVDLKADLESRYRLFDQAIARKDKKEVAKWIADNTTTDFMYVSKDKNAYKRDPFVKSIYEQIAATRSMDSVATKVATITVKGTTATLMVKSDTTAIMNFDGKAMRLVDKSTTKDTWVKVKNAWRLKSSVQTASDTQMFQQ